MGEGGDRGASAPWYTAWKTVNMSPSDGYATTQYFSLELNQNNNYANS